MKLLRLMAALFFAAVLPFSLASCGGGDDDDNGGNEQGDNGPQTPFEAQTFDCNGQTFTMVPVEGGTFMMGATDTDTDADASEKPQHAVSVGDFYICTTEVSQDLWKEIMSGNNPSSHKQIGFPVEWISMYDCENFITRLNQKTGKNFRLPTETEWEYAARGGKLSKNYKYAGGNNVNNVAWYGDNSENATHRVNTKEKNELGLYNMSGNVAEWTSTRWTSSYAENAQTDATYVVRGGSWNRTASMCRVTARTHFAPGIHTEDIGLRLAMSR